MDRSRPDQILDQWRSAAASAVPPAAAPRRASVRSSLPGLSLAGGAVLVAAVLLAVVWIGRPDSDNGIGAVPPVSPSPTATAEPTPTATATESPSASPSVTPAPAISAPPSPTPVVTPTPTPVPTEAAGPKFGTCAVADLDANIASWEGAAGSRIANVEMTYTGSKPCTIPSTSRLQLIDGAGNILIDGTGGDFRPQQAVIVGDHLTTMVQTSNYCGPDPIPAVRIVFVADGGGRLGATPVSRTDATVPPCNGPGQPAAIEMHPWQR